MSNILCFQCGEAEFQVRRMSAQGSRNNETFDVEVEGLECPACGCRTFNSQQGEALTAAVSAAYRHRHGLLSESDIKARRESAKMSQAQFAEYLGVGVASVKRWEAGQIQDKALDELIRLKTDPATARANVQRVEALFASRESAIMFSATLHQLWSPKPTLEIKHSGGIVRLPEPAAA